MFAVAQSWGFHQGMLQTWRKVGSMPQRDAMTDGGSRAIIWRSPNPFNAQRILSVICKIWSLLCWDWFLPLSDCPVLCLHYFLMEYVYLFCAVTYWSSVTCSWFSSLELRDYFVSEETSTLKFIYSVGLSKPMAIFHAFYIIEFVMHLWRQKYRIY